MTATINRYDTIDIREVPSRLRRTARTALKERGEVYVEYRENERGQIQPCLTRNPAPVGTVSGGLRVTSVELVIDEEEP